MQHIDEAGFFVATDTLDTRQLLRIPDTLTAQGKQNVKRRLGLQRARYLAFIGRLQPRKQIPCLLDVYAFLRSMHRLDLGLPIISEGDQAPLKARVAEPGVKDVHFLGALPDADAGTYLFASDVMVMPGWLGLAVNHASVFGLSVVSHRFGKSLFGHGPEAACVEQCVTGWFA